MTVEELIEKLSELNPDYEVWIEGSEDFIFTEDDDNNELNIELGE
jgi:hypothetical protein